MVGYDGIVLYVIVFEVVWGFTLDWTIELFIWSFTKILILFLNLSSELAIWSNVNFWLVIILPE